MRAHRVLGDVQPLCDLVRRQVLVEEQQHLELSRGKLLRDRVGDASDLVGAGAHAVEQPSRDGAGEGGLAVDDAFEKFRDPLRRLLDRVRDGGRLDSGVPESIAGELSAREVEVLLLLDEHLGTDEIAKRLFISEHTVRSHVKSLLRKLGVSSRREALEQLSLARAA